MDIRQNEHGEVYDPIIKGGYKPICRGTKQCSFYNEEHL